MLRTTCPHARAVEGATPGTGGVVCGAMERDAARADRILEGAPVGVFLTVKDDPSTIQHFCCGTQAPSPNPDGEPVAHFSSCPVYLADGEIESAQRAFALKAPEETPGLEMVEEPEMLTGVDGALEWERAMKEAGQL